MITDVDIIRHKLSHAKYRNEIKDAMERAQTIKEYKRIMAVWMCRVNLIFRESISVYYIKETLLFSSNEDVERIHKDYIKHGCGIFVHKGGRCLSRCNIKLLSEEREFLMPFFLKDRKINPREVHDAYLIKLGRKHVHMSTIYRLIKRHEKDLQKLCDSSKDRNSTIVPSQNDLAGQATTL